MNFTPGPWTYEPEAYHRDNIYAGKNIIAQAVGDSAETEANARLIAAAPDLLALLMEITPAFNTTRMIMDSQEAREMAGNLVLKARAAIEKATVDKRGLDHGRK